MKISKRTQRDATQLFRSCQVKGLLDEDRARKLIRQIAATKPRDYLGLLSYFLHLVKLDKVEHTAKVESAKPLPPDMQEGVRAGLARTYGPGLATSFVENPALIAGMRIRVGSDVYDGSFRGRLVALERSL